MFSSPAELRLRRGLGLSVPEVVVLWVRGQWRAPLKNRTHDFGKAGAQGMVLCLGFSSIPSISGNSMVCRAVLSTPSHLLFRS